MDHGYDELYWRSGIGLNAALIFEMELVSVLKNANPGNAADDRASAGKRSQ